MKVQGRRVFEGQASGKVALSTAPLSFLGEIDPATGKVENPASELNGRTISGQVLVFPEARGSTVGPYVIYGAKKRGVAPAAMVIASADAIVATAAVLARMPCVTGVDIDLFVDGETVVVDGSAGTVDLPAVKETHVVSCFLQRRSGEVLLLRRSEKVGTFQGRWATVTGYLEDPTPREQALREIREEVGVSADELHLENEGPPVYARDGGLGFVIHPYRFSVKDPTIKLDWEHTEFEWVKPSDIVKREIVPKLERVWAAVAPARSPAALAPA